MTVLQKYGIWIAIVVLSLLFAGAGIAKLMGVEQMHVSFTNMGTPKWFGYFIGASEVAGAAGLYIRRLSTLAAAGLAVIMLGAIGYHVTFDPLQLAIPAVALLILLMYVAQIRLKDAFWTVGA